MQQELSYTELRTETCAACRTDYETTKVESFEVVYNKTIFGFFKSNARVVNRGFFLLKPKFSRTNCQ